MIEECVISEKTSKWIWKKTIILLVNSITEKYIATTSQMPVTLDYNTVLQKNKKKPPSLLYNLPSLLHKGSVDISLCRSGKIK